MFDFWPLQTTVFPTPPLGVPEKLYWHKRQRTACDIRTKTCRMLKGGQIDFESYFNSFSLRDWAHFCGLDNFWLRVSGEGEVLLSIHHVGPGGQCLIASELLRLDGASPALLALPIPGASETEASQQGYLYVICYSQTGAVIEEITYGTATPPRRPVRLGGVITHFRREALVLPAMRRFAEELAGGDDFGQAFSLAVVDNSCSLPTTEVRDGIEIIPNGNYGGAGGFSRGLLHFAGNGRFTHVLFMDDDATLELASIKRTIAYLAYESSPRAAVAGTLFINPSKTVVYEAGARLVNGVHHACRRGADVARRSGLLKLQEPETTPAYGGWWFFAFPVAAVEHYPFPYFVRGDDAAFGSSNAFDVRAPSGVACWGDSFSAKETPLHRYLDARHALRHAALFDSQHVGATVSTFCGWVRDLADSYRYAAAEATLSGMQDALQDSEFWQENVDLARIRSRMAPLVADEKFTSPDNLPEDVIRSLVRRKLSVHFLSSAMRGAVRGSWLRFIARKLTFNGHLWPRFLAPLGPVVLAKHAPPRLVFPYQSVLYLDESTGLALMCRVNLARYLRLRILLLRYRWTFRKNRGDFSRKIGESFAMLSTKQFWQGLYSGHSGSSADTPGQTRDHGPCVPQPGGRTAQSPRS